MDEELKAIVQRMIDAKESEENIAIVIQGWKPKKQNEVSSQGSKNTSQTSTEPLPTSQSNPFGNLNPTVPTINVATGKTGQAKVTAMNDRIAKVEKKGTDVTNTLGASLNNLYEGVLKTPRYVYDLFSAPQNFIAEQFNVPELATNYDNFLTLTNSRMGRSPLTLLDQLGDMYANDAKSFEDKQIKYEKGIYDSLKDGDFSNAGSQLVNQIVGSSPSIALMAMTSGAGSIAKLGTLSKTAINALPFASSKSNEIRDSEEIPNWLKPIYSGANGLTEVIFDQKFGTQAIINKIVDKFQREGREVAVEEGKKFVTGYLTKALKGIKEPLSDIGKNAVEEMATTLSQNIIDKATINPDKDLMEGVFDAGIVGGAMGGGISGVGAVISPKSKAVIAEKTKAIEELTNDLDSDIPEATKETILSQVGKLKNEVQKEITKADEQFEALEESDKEKAIDLGAKIDSIDKSLAQEGISETTKTVLTEQKTALEEQLAEIKPLEAPKVESEVITPVEEVKVTEDVKTTSKKETKVPEYFNVYEEAVKGSQTKEEAFAKVTENGAVLSDTFNRKYNPDGKLTPEQTFEKFYNEIKPSVQEPTEQGGTKPRFTIKGETVTPKTEEINIPPLEPEVSGIKKSLVPQKVVKSVDFEKITDKEMQSLGKELYESGKIKPKEIVDEIAVNNQRRALQPEEVTTLIHYKTVLDNEYRDLLKQKNDLVAKGEPITAVNKEIAVKEGEIREYGVMSVITAQQQSLAFRLRMGALDKDYNYATQVEKYKAENSDGVIPPNVIQRFKEYDTEFKQLKEQIATERQRVTDLEAQSSVNNIVEDVKRESDPKGLKRKKAEADLKKAKDDFNNFIKKSRGQANSFADVATFVKQATKLVKAYAGLGIINLQEVIAEMRKDYGDDFVDSNLENIEATYQTINADKTKPYVVGDAVVVPSSYIRNAVKSGTTDINELSQQVLDEVQIEVPNATLRQVRDAITGYGKTVNQTKDEVRADINRAKRLGKLYSQLEDAQNGIEKAKNVKTVENLTAEEIEIKKRIKALENEIPKTTEQLEVENTKRIETKKRYYEKYIAEKEQRITEENFAPKAKKLPPTPDTELLELEKKANEIRDKYDQAHFENQQKNRTKWQKIKEEIIAWTLDLSRNLVAGFDLSVLGVQLVIHSTTTSRKNASEIVGGMFKAMASESFEKNFLAKVRVHPLYEIMKSSGLALQFPTTKISQRDAEIGTGRITRLWNAMASLANPISKTLAERIKLFNPSRASERAFTVPIDIARIQLFEGFVEQLTEEGITFENSPEQYKLAAKVANVLTFRGNLGIMEPIAKEVAMLFFAPRKISATMSMLNPAFYVNTYRTNPQIAKAMMFKMARFIGQAVLFTTLFKAFFDDEDKDSNPDIFNPYSSDFMKLRIGNTRIDFLGGMSGYFVFLARFISTNFKSTSRYKTETLGDRVGIPSNRGVLTWDFSKNKFAPLPSLLTRAIESEFKKGQELDWDEEAIKTVTPIWTQSISELYKEHPKEMATFLLTMSLVGQSMNTYGTAEFLDQDKDKTLVELVGRKNGAFQTRTKASLNFYDQNTGELRTANSDEFEKYKESYGEYIKEELQSNYSKLDKMTIPDFEKELTSIKQDAKKYAEYTIGKSVNKINEISDTDSKDKTITYELTPDQIVERWSLVDKQLERLNKTIDRRTDNLARIGKISKSLARKKVQVIVEKDAEKIATREMLRKYFDITTKKSKLKIKE